MALRQNIPQGAQGAFITTSDFQKQALDVATQPGFPRIGTMNGNQLVDLLAEKWNELEQSDDLHELLEKLRLKRGLILDE
jgi:restriction system protein